MTDGLTWADRVKGLSKPSQIGVRSSTSDCGGLTQGPVTSNRDDTKDGWETVTRFRSKSASAAYRNGGRNGSSHKQKHKTRTKPSGNNTNSQSTSNSSSRSGSSSIELSTPILDEPVFVVSNQPPTEVESPLPSVTAESTKDEEPVGAYLEEAKKKTEASSSNNVVTTTLCAVEL